MDNQPYWTTSPQGFHFLFLAETLLVFTARFKEEFLWFKILAIVCVITIQYHSAHMIYTMSFQFVQQQRLSVPAVVPQPPHLNLPPAPGTPSFVDYSYSKSTFVSASSQQQQQHHSQSTKSSPNNNTTMSQRNPLEVFVGNLSYFCEEKDLFELFNQYATVTNVRVMRSDDKSRSLMFGFVMLTCRQELLEICRLMNGHLFQGRHLR
jgi:hypothetical protein